MNISLIDKVLNEDTYEEYVDKIINIFRLSNKESSIVFNINIKDYKATVQLSIINNSGEKKDFSDEIFKCDDVFYKNFILSLVKEIDDKVKVIVKDIIRDDDSSLVTFRLVTDNNDIFTIERLSEDDAKSLLNYLNNDNDNNKLLTTPNNDGVGSIALFLFMSGVLVVAFILIVTIIG